MSDESYYTSEAFARAQDAGDPLKHLREEFVIPTKQDLKRKRLDSGDDASSSTELCTYMCGNSLGLQPKLASTYIQKYLQVWATQGVYGHFRPLEDQLTSPWLDIDEDSRGSLGKIVGARGDEISVMGSLTGNLHLLMNSFYRPTKERWKIIIEGKAFPSDHYAVESQLRHHGFDPKGGMIVVEPPNPEQLYLPTSHILSIITENASETALVLLPGIQFYTGQFFDIPKITAHAQSLGITVGWDLAHAVGNVPLQLHDWGVDFAAWCHYKYLNSGPGAIAGLFVHEKHSKSTNTGDSDFVPRLSGWWGSDKGSRFQMSNQFVPIPGAAGWQVSNPSALDSSAVLASLAVFDKTSMADLREKSGRITGYLKSLLHPYLTNDELEDWQKQFSIITPHNPAERGAQLSLLLKPGLLETVMEVLEEEGVVVDERRPDVIRVAPAPLYNTYYDAWQFVQVFKKALTVAASKAG